MFSTIIPLVSAVASILSATTNVLPPDVANAVVMGTGAVGTAAMIGAMKTPKVVDKFQSLAEPENARQYRDAPLWVKTLSQAVVSFGRLVDVIAFNWGRASNKR
jgi:hypothetical protein